jgi:hypothetical protein
MYHVNGTFVCTTSATFILPTSHFIYLPSLPNTIFLYFISPVLQHMKLHPCIVCLAFFRKLTMYWTKLYSSILYCAKLNACILSMLISDKT